MSLALLLGVRAGAADPREGQPVDVVPFGMVTRWSTEGKDHGVVWEDARDIHRVVIAFEGKDAAPRPESLRLEYWQSGWPHRRIPRDTPSGAGSSGWLDVGDWFQGKWRTADSLASASPGGVTFTFRAVNANEFKDLGDFAATYRTTMKLRVASDAPLPPVASLEAYTDSEWRPLEFDVEWGGTAEEEQTWDGRLEAFNGFVRSVLPLGERSAVKVAKDLSWASKVKERTDGIHATVLYAAAKGYNSFDEAIFTVRAEQETFSFAASDLMESGSIFIPDFGVLVRKSAVEGKDPAAKDSRAGQALTYELARMLWEEKRRNERELDLHSRVFTAPEQTFPQAWNDMPIKESHYIPLSFEGSRQHFGVEANGEVFALKNWISRLRGKDTPRCLWKGEEIRYSFGFPGGPPRDRGLEDGTLPIISATWEASGISYRQTVLVVPLLGVPARGSRIWADDPLVLLARIEMQSKVPEAAVARLVLGVADAGEKQALSLQGDLSFQGDIVRGVHGDAKVPRMLFRPVDPSQPFRLVEQEAGLVYEAELAGKDSARVVDVAIPFITLEEDAELARLRAIRFDDALRDVKKYWVARFGEGAQIVTPEPLINDFYRAHTAHLLINTEREVGVSDRYMAKVGTFHYGVYANESCMMVSDLDRRGYHERAAQALETWLYYQGTVGLPGDFSSREGQLYGAGGYEHGGYNQHHGWVLWCLGEHYFYTRDGAWLARVAPGIVAGCEWIQRERKRTIDEAERNPIRAIERGLLPPGRLEDIGDWRCWLSTNVFSWWGMQNAAAALTAGGEPDGPRLVEEAEAYRRDILAAFLEATRRSPVVRLRDSSWIPHVPADVHRRGRSFGWITETLEGAIHMVRCGLLDPWDRMSTAIQRDFEDNLYISEQFGYDMKGDDFERYWFSRGGISMQANLLCSPLPYLLRDEPKHYLRSYFNAFAASFFPDTRMMTEHALPNIGDWRGDHYKSSDESNSTFWLRLMFIEERGDELRLGSMLPRYWLADGQKLSVKNAATYFGPMSLQVESAAASGRIQMMIEPPSRNPPSRILARFRHPTGQRMTRCEVNGQPYDAFDPEREWVELTRFPSPTTITAFYD